MVKEELRQRVLANPYGRLFGLFDAAGHLHQVHPYRRPGIGSIEDLDAATLEDVRAFHATYYRPDNAAPDRGRATSTRPSWTAGSTSTSRPLEDPGRPLPRVTVVEPAAHRSARRSTAYGPNVPLPAVLPSPGRPRGLADPDAPALTVLDGILSTGESSRLYTSRWSTSSRSRPRSAPRPTLQQQAGLF